MRALRLLFVILIAGLPVHAQNDYANFSPEHKFSPDTKLFIEKGVGSYEAISRGTKNGVRFGISHSFARGSVEAERGADVRPEALTPRADVWHLFWSRDPSTSVKRCWVVRQGITFIQQSKDDEESSWLTVSSAHLWDVPSTVEVDGKVIYGGKKLAPDAVQRLRSGKMVTIQMSSGETKVLTFSMYGFSEATELCDWVLKLMR